MRERQEPTPGAQRFTGAAAVVTGGAAGIGAASARRLAAEGAHVFVADIDDSAGLALVETLREESLAADYVHCDVSQSGDWLALRDAVSRTTDRLDVLHSNAYMEVPGSVHELDESDWDRQMSVTLKAAFLGVKTFVDMLRAARGCVIVTSSVHARFGFRGRPAYAAAKGALSALTRQLAVDYGPEVRVNSVEPGPILTHAWDDADQSDRDAVAAATVLGRLGWPEEVAAAVAFLASADSSYITGVSLIVDGGWSAFKEAR